MEDEKLSGRVIIDTILANMGQQVEELRYSKVVPAAYDVYLHPDDQQRFERLAHEIAAEAVRALQERLDALNRPSRLDKVRDIVRKPRLPYKKVGPWLVRIACDPEGAVPRGRALVVSQIVLAGAESYEGQRTRRLSTLSDPVASDLPLPPASSPTTRPAPPAPPRAADADLAETHEIATAEAFAMIAWEDQSGSHRFRMTTPEATVGRAVQGSNADVRLATAPDVSRVHLRIRHDAESRRFTIEDLSLLGTTVNGQILERGAPSDLPSPADIRLADAITLRFEREAS
jgi:hypothetical protein